MTIFLCERCGDVTLAGSPCRCATPCDPTEVRRRHRDALARARTTDELIDDARHTARRVA